jgi:hypothetical protein
VLACAGDLFERHLFFTVEACARTAGVTAANVIQSGMIINAHHVSPSLQGLEQSLVLPGGFIFSKRQIFFKDKKRARVKPFLKVFTKILVLIF